MDVRGIGTFKPGKYRTRDGSIAVVEEIWGDDGYYLRGYVELRTKNKSTKWASNTGFKICYRPATNRHNLVERIGDQ